jgi:N,N'-diacetyllegionaminate synthase
MLIIAEIGQAHDGSLGTAHAYIDAVARTKANAVKFQTHIAAAESSRSDSWRVKFSPQDASRYDYWRRMEFTPEQWAGLRHHAEEKDLAFLSSPFSLEAVELLIGCGISSWKIASGELTNEPLLRRVAQTGLPIILSSGMSSWTELDAATNLVKAAGCDLTVMQCTSAYPTPPSQLGLNLIAGLKNRYECKAGLSDHSGTIFAGLAAATLGADAVEVHVTFSRDSFGPDVSSSVTIAELAQMVEGIGFIQQALDHPVDKDQAATSMAPMRKLFTRSIVALIDLSAGQRLLTGHLTLRKPGTGLSPARLPSLVGKVMRHDVPAGNLLTEDDFEN